MLAGPTHTHSLPSMLSSVQRVATGSLAGVRRPAVPRATAAARPRTAPLRRAYTPSLPNSPATDKQEAANAFSALVGLVARFFGQEHEQQQAQLR